MTDSRTAMRNLKLLGVALFLAAFLGSTQGTQAQPNLNFKRVTANWPTIELYFSVGCNGNPAYNMTKQDFRIFENGVEVKDFTLWCPDPTIRCAISVALVFDVSGSMMGTGNAGAKAAGRAFVDLMDGVVDEATIVAFNNQVTILQQMTTIKPMLLSAVSALGAGGMTAVWDGIYVGIEELINNGVNQCRAVIVMTDGVDNSSQRTPSEIISIANRNRIRVFTIGLGSGINGTELQQIALLTGGKYYQTPNAGQLAAIYQEISTIIFQGFQECIITYDRLCADGSLRTVELQLVNFCGGTDSKTKTYRAPLDSTTFSDLYMDLGEAECKGDEDVTIPLDLITPIFPEEMFYPLTFTLLFDESCVQFKGVKTPPGSILEGIAVDVTPVVGGVQIRSTDRVLVSGNGLLMQFEFHASDPLDTTCCAIEAIDVSFDQGCFIPIIEEGEICIFPRVPVVACDLVAPQELVWQRAIKDYTPNPFPVTGRFFNTGDKEAENTRFKITYNPADLQLVTPLTDVQTGTPRDIVPGAFSEVIWQLAAKRRTTGDSTEICITASFDNHEDVTCCVMVYIPPTEPILECEIDVPDIVADNINLRYIPMPFPVTVTVRNLGGMRTDSIFATIIVPADLSLAGIDAPDNHTKRVLPSVLLPGGQAMVSWMVKHPATLVEREYAITVWVKSQNDITDSSMCEVTVKIPELDSPILAPRCYVPDELFFDEALDAYTPNPFTVRLTTYNKGNTEARNVTGTIILPANVEFDPAGQSETKTFNPSTLPKWNIGDPIPELTWTVRWTKRFRYNDIMKFRWTVTGESFTGIQLDSSEVRCEVPVPGLMPLYNCVIAMPDSLPLNAAENNVTPNPFTVSYTVTNNSNQVGKITRIYINFPPDGLLLSPTSPNPINQALDLTLNPGESATFDWVIDVQNRITRRNVRISVVAIDDEGNPVECYDWLPIANLKTALMCDLRTSEPLLTYLPVLQDYDPKSFVLSATLTNSGGANLNNVIGDLKWLDQSGLDLIEMDPDFTDNTNPKTRGVLFPQQSVTFQWGFRLKNKNLSDISQFIEFDVTYGSDETPTISNACLAYVEVEPVVSPILTCSLGGPDTVYFNVDRYNPTPFDVDVHINNLGTGRARNVKVYLLQDTRFTIVSPSYRVLSDIEPQTSVDLLGPDGFTLKVNPRDVDGYDTVRAVVVADGVSTTCELPIFVERELRPRFEMTCVTGVTLRFDDALNDYVPSPFPVEVTVTNVGDTRAEDCEMIFVGPPRFMPFDQVMSVDIGTLEVGESYRFDWNMVPLRRDVGGTETMRFEVHGNGGLGQRLHIGTCELDIYVPPAQAPQYSCTVAAPDALVFDKGTGVYIPDPFQLSSQVTNTGLAEGMGITAEIILPPGLVLNTGEQQTKAVANLPSGSTSAPVLWNVRPIARSDDATLTMIIKFTDRFGNTTECTHDVFVPEAPEPGLDLSCESDLYALEVDPQRGEYKQGSFKVRGTVTNRSGRPVYNVRVTVLPMDRDLKVDPNDANPQQVAVQLDDGVTAPSAEWTLIAALRTQSGDIPVKFLVTGEDVNGTPVPTRECEVLIYVPEVGRPKLGCQVLTNVRVPDGEALPHLVYDETAGDYEGTQSSYGNYTVFTVTVDVDNFTGEALARGVRATILFPEGVSLEEGQTAIKYLSPEDIAVKQSARVTWTFKPQHWPTEELRRFDVVVTAENAEPTGCTLDLLIDAAPKVVVVSMPDDAVGSYGEKITVPIVIGETTGRDVYAYKLNVRFNPAHVKFVDASSAGTLTERGWNGPKPVVYTEQGSSESNIVRVEDFTTGSMLSTSRMGALVFLRFEAIHNPEDITDVQQDALGFVPRANVEETGVELVSSMNSVEDDKQGSVTLVMLDGMVTVSGDCILPLTASSTTLYQNKPNPFNPSTVIEYTLGEESDYVVTLYDALGRQVEVIESGHKSAGRYQLRFESGDLPSGVYLYRLETPKYSETRRMILSR